MATEPEKHKNAEAGKDETVIHVVTTNPEQHYYVSTATPPASSRKRIAVSAAVLLLVIAAAGAFNLSSGNNKTSPRVRGGTASFILARTPGEVTITGAGFEPATVSIKAGQAVTWVNEDSAPHLIASDPYPTDNTLADFNSRDDMSQNDRYTLVFDKAGTYTYHDDLNPYSLGGTVIVR